jgi:DNA-directed RNA polymerase III subunit RPC3
LVLRVGIAANGGKFAINWQQAFKNLQLMLLDNYVEGIYGAHHTRVVRILRQKGFLEEKELTKLSLLPQKNLRVILSRLTVDSIV